MTAEAPPAPAPTAEPKDRPWPWAALAIAGALVFFGCGWLLAAALSEPGRPPARTAVAAGPSNTELQLAARVARLEAEQRTVARIAAASLTVSSLNEAASKPTGFAEALRTAESVLPASPDLVALRELAVQGAPTEAGLIASFPAVAARARAAARPVDAGSALSGWSRALGRVFGEEPARPPPGAAPDAVLARAEALLRGGNLPAAVDQLALLPPPARDAFATWTGHARRRIEIERRLAAVRAMTLRDLAAVTAPAERPL